jgi:hypothetical protein
MTAPVTTYAARAAVLRILARGPHTGATLRRAVRYAHRGGLAAALAELTAAGMITATSARGDGIRYSLAEPVHPSIPAAETRRRNAGQSCDRCGVRKRRATGLLCGTCLAEAARGTQQTYIGEKGKHV